MTKEERSLSYEHSRFFQVAILHEEVHCAILLPGRTDPGGCLPRHPGRDHSCIYHRATEPVHGLADTESKKENVSTLRTVLDGVLSQGKRAQGKGVILFPVFFCYIMLSSVFLPRDAFLCFQSESDCGFLIFFYKI